MGRKGRTIPLLVATLLCAQGFAQQSFSELIAKYPFVNPDTSQILNAEALNPWFIKLGQLENTQQGRLVIAHIGDSHVQAGNFSEPIRRNLQLEFGFAGRGLIFPYQAAGTNGPPDYIGTSAVKWKSRRNAHGTDPQPTGISGHSIYTIEKAARLEFRMKAFPVERPPERLVVFHGSIADGNYNYQVLDSAGNGISTSVISDVYNPMVSTFSLDTVTRKFKLAHVKDSPGKSSILYGISAENNSPGILFHTIGVNGAEYHHYSEAAYFTTQLGILQPDLIIISLGTNEAFNFRNFDTLRFYRQADSLITRIRENCPNAVFLLTVPPEIGKAVKKGRRYSYVPNQQVPLIRDQLMKLAIDRNLAVWDFYAVMGGHGSIAKWHKAGLTDARRIHFNRTGYYIEGYLMWKALNNSYRNFLLKNPGL